MIWSPSLGLSSTLRFLASAMKASSRVIATNAVCSARARSAGRFGGAT